eukprot:TRINITY_DN17314_c0_g1_i3.p1 TRINITY_DN17314_c0_g1~~TRINITY_DN17314_c0_g1_i3.p1  ORF type:complete len:298 (-),score=41.45 TRINITY_DN17314_c0_g1_i3:256-1149(-)
MLSAKAPVERTTIQSFESGATDFVAKPFHPEILRKKVAAVLSLRMSGVRLTAAVVAASEACQRLNQDDMEATTAKEHPADLQAKLNETVVRAAEAIEKAKHLELELVSVKEWQTNEHMKLSKKCDDMLLLMERNELKPFPPSATGQSGARCKSDFSEHLAIAELKCRKIYRYKTDSASDASFVINLLVSRLQACSKSAKNCKDLLRGCFHPSVQGADQDDAAGIFSTENLCCQLSKFRRRTEFAVSKLAMLEDISSNLGGIMDMAGDEEFSTDSEALEHQSCTSSQTGTVSPTVASI